MGVRTISRSFMASSNEM